jgi:hypothetical protein
MIICILLLLNLWNSASAVADNNEVGNSRQLNVTIEAVSEMMWVRSKLSRTMKQQSESLVSKEFLVIKMHLLALVKYNVAINLFICITSDGQ